MEKLPVKANIELLPLFSCQVVPDSLWPHGLQNARLPCPSLSVRVCSNSCPLSQWYHPTILSSVPPSSPALNLSQHQGLFQQLGSFHQVAKVLEFRLQYQSFQWGISLRISSPFPSNELISLMSKGLSRVFSNTTVWKHQLFDAQPTLWSNSTFLPEYWKGVKSFAHKYNKKSSNCDRGEQKRSIGNAFRIKRPTT